MAPQTTERPAIAHLGAGAVFIVGAWAFWPAGETFVQHWMGVYTALFFGGIFIVGGLLRLREERRQRDLREAAGSPSGAYGTAAFATAEQCEAAGLMDPRGLFLGAIDGEPLFWNGKAHLLTCAPARQGKGISVVVPNLLHWTGSVFVTDPKGELAAVTGWHRVERFGQDVYVLNPWGLHGLPQHRFNPLQRLVDLAGTADGQRGLIDEARSIALQLLAEPPDPKNRYFRDGARGILVASMLWFAVRGEPEQCTLVELWRTVNSISRLKRVLREMAECDALGGMLIDLADDLQHAMDETPGQFADFRQGAAQAVSIFDPSGWLGDCVAESDFDFGELKDRAVSIYVVIPPERIPTHGAWIGLLARQGITAVAEKRSRTPVLFLLDEFANMGKLSGLAESLTTLPGFGVRVWIIVQELADIRRVYGNETAATILAQAEVKQYFAVQSLPLAKELSDALGTRTVKTRSFNLGKRETDEIGESVNEAGRPLLAPDNIRMLPADKQILLIRSEPPILADRVPFWTVDPWQDWADANPIEGDHPRPASAITLNYQRGVGRT